MLGDQLGVHVSPVFGRWIWFVVVLCVLTLAVTCVPAEKRRAVSILLLAFTLPIVLLCAVSLVVRPVLIPRVLLPTVVPMVLLFGALAASTSIRPVWRRAGLGGLFVILLLGDFYGFRYDTKEQWREASHYLQEHVRPADVVLVNLSLSSRNVTLAVP
jgi:hypothetical protein